MFRIVSRTAIFFVVSVRVLRNKSFNTIQSGADKNTCTALKQPQRFFAESKATNLTLKCKILSVPAGRFNGYETDKPIQINWSEEKPNLSDF